MYSKKIFTFALLVLLCVFAAACSRTAAEADAPLDEDISQTESSSAKVQSEKESPETTTESETTLAPEPEDISDTAADELCRKYGAVSVQAAVIRDGKVTATYEYGLADRGSGRKTTRETKYRVASLSKLAAEIVFMRLCDEGLADTHTDIGEYLGYEVRNPSYPDVPVTAEMLMAHTSSVIDSSAFLTSRQNHSSVPLKELLQSGGSYSAAEPGTSYAYSNFGVAVLGAVCEKITGRHFYELARDYLFDKLGIDAAFTASMLENTDELAVLYGFGGYSVSQQLNESFCDELAQTHHLVQGNLTISARDYAKLICVLLNNGKAESGEVILSPESVKEMLSDHYNGAEELGYGVWFSENYIDGEKVAAHTGSNFGMFSSFVFSPEKRNGVVVLTSGADGSIKFDEDMTYICLELIRHFGIQYNEC